MTMPLISVFTPSYNRAGKLHRVFTSLLKQTLTDFEWIIVDDGSVDDTKAVVEKFIQEQPSFKIRYFFQPNAGKHIAINKGLELATGEWFHIADSDDELEPNTLEVFMKTWENIPDERKELFCGICACCKDQYGNRISDAVPNGTFDGSFRDMFYKHHFRKEAFMINKTAIMREFPFPEHLRNFYFPEAITWRKMTDKYMLRFISNEMRIYYIEEEHSLMSGTGKSPQSKALPNCLECSTILNEDLRYFIYYPGYFLKRALVYHSFFPFLNKNQREWVSLRPAARLFAFAFIVAGRIYNKILEANYKKKTGTAT
jgi:glycosyltransferase involved in cell wall biosynthesis